MFKTQKGICLKGGLEASRITSSEVEIWKGLSIYELWLACDSSGALKPLQKAVQIIRKAGYKKRLYVYVLIGTDRVENEARLKEVRSMGCYPFAQLLQPADNFINYSKEWKSFAREWSRPCIFKTKEKKDFNDVLGDPI
jgi:hypothetical protein